MITFKQHQIKIISKILNEGQVVALPTDTVYGLACNFNDDNAINQIYKIKNRNINKPLPILVGSWDVAKLIGVISDELELYLKTNFPIGKVTFIVSKQPILNTSYWNKQSSVAIRVSNSSFIQKLTKITGPLVATSCNLSDSPVITNIDDINLPYLKYKVAGPILNNKPSIIFNSFNGKIIR